MRLAQESRYDPRQQHHDLRRHGLGAELRILGRFEVCRSSACMAKVRTNCCDAFRRVHYRVEVYSLERSFSEFRIAAERTTGRNASTAWFPPAAITGACSCDCSAAMRYATNGAAFLRHASHIQNSTRLCLLW